MKLALLTTIAFPIAFAAAQLRGPIPELFGAEQIAFVGAPCQGCAPDYCYPKYEAVDYFCYREGYPACCSKTKGNCPNNNQPGCECQGDCNPGGSTGTRDLRCSIGDGTCKGEDFCLSPAGSCGGTSDGRCTSMPVVCNMNIQEVCGCNGETYDNDCDAFSVGVNVDYTGSC
jgi:hypothetical protein